MISVLLSVRDFDVMGFLLNSFGGLIEFVTAKLFPHFLEGGIVLKIFVILRPVKLIFLFRIFQNLLPIFGLHFLHYFINVLIRFFNSINSLNSHKIYHFVHFCSLNLTERVQDNFQLHFPLLDGRSDIFLQA